MKPIHSCQLLKAHRRRRERPAGAGGGGGGEGGGRGGGGSVCDGGLGDHQDRLQLRLETGEGRSLTNGCLNSAVDLRDEISGAE